MNPEKAIRAESRTILRNNWVSGIGVFFILFASVLLALFVFSVIGLLMEISFTALFGYLETISPAYSLTSDTSFGSVVYSNISGLSMSFLMLAGFVFVFMVYCGVKRYFYMLSKGEKPGVHEVFYYLAKGRKKRALGFAMGYGFLSFLKLLLCEAVAIVVALYSASHDLSGFYLLNETLLVTSIIFAFGGFALWLLWTSKHFLSFYLFNENENLSVRECKNQSARILRGNLGNSTNKLIFSFAGWFLLALTGVGMLYFVPYFETASATSAKWILKLDKEVH